MSNYTGSEDIEAVINTTTQKLYGELSESARATRAAISQGKEDSTIFENELFSGLAKLSIETALRHIYMQGGLKGRCEESKRILLRMLEPIPPHQKRGEVES